MAPTVARRTLLAALALACLALVPFLRDDLGPSRAFVPAALTAVVAFDVLTGALLVVRFLVRGSSSLLMLACAYLFAGLMAAFHGLVLPGGFGDTGVLHGAAHAPAWSWVLGHAGLPVGIALALWGGPSDMRRALAAPSARRHVIAGAACGSAVAAVVALGWLMLTLGSTLPGIADGDSLSAIGLSAGGALVAVELLVLAVVLRRGRRTALERRLFLVIWCLLAGTALAVAAAHRFTLGWYASWVLDLVTSAVVLVTLLTEAGRLGGFAVADQRTAATDDLTGVLSRGAALVAAEHLHQARTAGVPLALALVDVDGLKAIGDKHGALAADAVLVTVANRLRQELRDEDILGRAGDEGFLIVLPQTDLDGVTLAIDRAVAAVRAEPVGTWAHDVRTTASGGIAMVGEGDDAVAEALAAADLALNRAKAYGRDQVVSPARGLVVPLRRAGSGPQPESAGGPGLG